MQKKNLQSQLEHNNSSYNMPEITKSSIFRMVPDGHLKLGWSER